MENSFISLELYIEHEHISPEIARCVCLLFESRYRLTKFS